MGILPLLLGLFCFICPNVPDKKSIDSNHIFVLVFQTNDDLISSPFEIGNLIKSKYPTGVVRFNKIEEKYKISFEQHTKISQASWELPFLCIENDKKNKTRCGFESIEHHDLAYVFKVSDDTKKTNGYIILRDTYNQIIDREIPSEENDEEGDSFNEDDEELPAYKPAKPPTFLEKLYSSIAGISVVKKTVLWCLIKYIETKKLLNSMIFKENHV